MTKRDRDYEQNLENAFSFTAKLGLNTPNFTLCKEKMYSRMEQSEISDAVVSALYYKNYDLSDVALQCFVWSHKLQLFLKEVYNIESLLTSGFLFQNGYPVFSESKRNIKNRLSNQNICTPVKFHTWLTLDNLMVIDMTYLPSIWFRNLYKGATHMKEEDYQKILWHNPLVLEDRSFCFKPIFVGHEYFEKVHVVPEVVSIVRP
jgi:hypothetical protein